MTDKQQRFVEEYLKDLNATAAAVRAGYSEKTAMEQGHQLLQKTSVSEAIQVAQQERAKRLQLDVDTVVANLANIAGANILDYLEQDGDLIKLKDLNTLSPQQLTAIESIKHGKYGIELKLYSKLTASDMLMKHLGGYITSSDLIDKLPAERLERLVNELLQKLQK